MEIAVERNVFTSESTISDVYVDGIFECHILEDAVREVPGRPVTSWKVYGKTAIPQGRYKVERTMSPRFGKMLPLLVGVPGFAGVRIHPGNRAKDTEGCLLPGTFKGKDIVTESAKAFAKLDAAITEALEAGEDVWLEIRGLP